MPGWWEALFDNDYLRVFYHCQLFAGTYSKDPSHPDYAPSVFVSKQSGPSSRLERYERVERQRKRKRDVEAAATLIEISKYPRQTTDDRELTEPTQSEFYRRPQWYIVFPFVGRNLVRIQLCETKWNELLSPNYIKTEFPMSFDSIQNQFPPWFDELGQFRHSSCIFIQSVTCTLQAQAGIDDVIWALVGWFYCSIGGSLVMSQGTTALTSLRISSCLIAASSFPFPSNSCTTYSKKGLQSCALGSRSSHTCSAFLLLSTYSEKTISEAYSEADNFVDGNWARPEIENLQTSRARGGSIGFVELVEKTQWLAVPFRHLLVILTIICPRIERCFVVSGDVLSCHFLALFPGLPYRFMLLYTIRGHVFSSARRAAPHRTACRSP